MNNLKRNKYKNSGNQNIVPNNDKYYNCDKPGHFKRDCPYPEWQNPPMNNEPAKKRKRAFTATLDDSDSSSSDDDQKRIIRICITQLFTTPTNSEKQTQKKVHVYNTIG